MRPEGEVTKSMIFIHYFHLACAGALDHENHLLVDPLRLGALESFVDEVAIQGKTLPGAEDIDLTDKDKVEAKQRIMESMEQLMEERFKALCHAARTGDADAVSTLARQGANLNQADYDGKTALRELRRAPRAC